MSAKRLSVIMTVSDLEQVRVALNEARLACDRQDCFSCSNFGEISRRITKALESLKT